MCHTNDPGSGYLSSGPLLPKNSLRQREKKLLLAFCFVCDVYLVVLFTRGIRKGRVGKRVHVWEETIEREGSVSRIELQGVSTEAVIKIEKCRLI